eukprot:CAMPEP_0176225570 /NCGR_PEP_ID=MMETSP0121_2-20121125/21825_1 /TAXON_ID=160619 /ORGANISM="Kryptoperidinium foliaceum, Strain CCMP 1326" /LENGTH=281 /DNA_ID=CAMNT_0017564833 /DNA_START=70 /DNA_END=915 /DNA_ORIENTATION=+
MAGPVALLVAMALADACAAMRGHPAAGRMIGGVSVDAVVEEGGGLAWTGNGSQVEPFLGKKVEGSLPNDAFTCLHGQIYGIRIPSQKPPREVFVYVKLNPIQDFYPMQVYLDLSDMRRQFVLVPPVDDWSTNWRLIARRADKMASDSVWLEEHLYELGKENPCGPEGDVEAAARAEKLERVRKAVAEAKAAQARAEAIAAQAREAEAAVREGWRRQAHAAAAEAEERREARVPSAKERGSEGEAAPLEPEAAEELSTVRRALRALWAKILWSRADAPSSAT